MATYRATIKFTYDANGGSNAPAATTNTYSTGSMGRVTASYAITSSKPTPPTGKHFVNWLVRYNGDTYSDISASPANYAYISSGGTQSVTYPASNYNNRTITFIYYATYAWNTYKVHYDANNGSGAPGDQTKTYGQTLKLSTTKPTRTGYTFQGWATSSGGAVAYAAGANYTVNAAVTLYAVWKINTWTVSYNANGGSGAPANQTKTYGSNLTLSSTKPTRTGYTFKGWSTTKARADAGTIDYAPGATYTANAALALYASWTLITYTIKYNINGGSGTTPTNQTKNYGQTLTLQTDSGFTRKGYKFLGWATSQAATSATYASGGSYTTNAAATMYAIWQQTYFAPTITNLVANRAIADGEGGYIEDDEGHVSHIKFNWAKGTNVGADVLPATCTIRIAVQGTGNWYDTVVTLTDGSEEFFITNPILDDASAYDVKVVFTVTGWNDVEKNTYISVAYYIMDVNPDGTAVSIGGVAKDNENKFKVFMPSEFGKSVAIGGSTTDGEDKFKVFIPSEFQTPSGQTLVTVSSERNTDTGFYTTRPDTGVSLFCGVGAEGANHGIWSYKENKWIIYANASHQVYVNNILIAKKPFQVVRYTWQVSGASNAGTKLVTATPENSLNSVKRPSGYTFLCWLQWDSIGWVGSIYASNPTDASTDVWTAVAKKATSGASIGAIALYIRNDLA